MFRTTTSCTCEPVVVAEDRVPKKIHSPAVDVTQILVVTDAGRSRAFFGPRFLALRSTASTNLASCLFQWVLGAARNRGRADTRQTADLFRPTSGAGPSELRHDA